MQARTKICMQCGKTSRGTTRCTCGGGELKPLSYEQGVAATQIKDLKKRVDWMVAGGRVTRVTGHGTRRWKAVV